MSAARVRARVRRRNVLAERAVVLLALLAAAAPLRARAQHEQHGAAPPAESPVEHGEHAPAPAEREPADRAQQGDSAVPGDAAVQEQDAIPASPPEAATAGPAHAADALFDPRVMAAARERLRREEGALRSQVFRADRVETRAGTGEARYEWDLEGWYGGDIHKLVWKSEGDGELGGNPEDAQLQALYSRAITPYFDFQAGVRRDFRPTPERSHLVVGVQGIMPYVFEIDAAAFVSEEGDLTGRVEAELDLRITQRLVLEPRIELGFAAQSVPELGTGSGLGSAEGALRLRYELRRELAPYVGVRLGRKVGATADFARAAGDDVRERELLVGVRAWF